MKTYRWWAILKRPAVIEATTSYSLGKYDQRIQAEPIMWFRHKRKANTPFHCFSVASQRARFRIYRCICEVIVLRINNLLHQQRIKLSSCTANVIWLIHWKEDCFGQLWQIYASKSTFKILLSIVERIFEDHKQFDS